MSQYDGGHRAPDAPRKFEVGAEGLRVGDVVTEPLIHGQPAGEVRELHRVDKGEGDVRIRIVFAGGVEMTCHRDLPFFIEWPERR